MSTRRESIIAERKREALRNSQPVGWQIVIPGRPRGGVIGRARVTKSGLVIIAGAPGLPWLLHQGKSMLGKRLKLPDWLTTGVAHNGRTGERLPLKRFIARHAIAVQAWPGDVVLGLRRGIGRVGQKRGSGPFIDQEPRDQDFAIEGAA
jgi:hypothetical protein